MNGIAEINCANAILYCSRWRECVRFYRQGIGLETAFENDWFVEFKLNDGARLSIANAVKASIDPAEGRGVTLTLKVEDLAAVREALKERGLSPGNVRRHGWGADVFNVRDPDGNRIEFWSE